MVSVIIIQLSLPEMEEIIGTNGRRKTEDQKSINGFHSKLKMEQCNSIPRFRDHATVLIADERPIKPFSLPNLAFLSIFLY